MPIAKHSAKSTAKPTVKSPAKASAKTAANNLDQLQSKIAGEQADAAEQDGQDGQGAQSADTPGAAHGPSAREQFAVLNLRKEVLQAIVETGYEKPTLIQLQTIPHVLAGRDLLGQAETGSGKTAAFACPLLSMIDLKGKQPQVLILAPTRELAIQVTAAIQTYAANLPGFRAVTIYGGQSYDIQFNQLKRGVHVVVGTPGRVMDHMRRNTLDLRALKCLVLDEADEMLRMGFVDDVEWILTKTPQQRQILLFSATLPEPIRRIASQHLKDPQQITVKGRNMTADAITQRYVETAAKEKIETLIRILASEPTDGVIVFVRTRNNTVEVAEKLTDAGYSAAPLNGDMAQSLRERTVDNFRRERLAVLVATDVAARGLDVNRVSHVINFDFPNDSEAYVHRIGRTGRAGRSGQAILFVGHREKGHLRRLEGATGQRLERMSKPSIESINANRVENFKQQIIDTAKYKDVAFFNDLIDQISTEAELSDRQIAAALAQLVHGDAPLLLKDPSRSEQRERYDAAVRDKKHSSGSQRATPRHSADNSKAGERRTAMPKRQRQALPTQHMSAYRVEVGYAHGVEAKNIVGAIANESGLPSAKIGRIEILDRHSTVDLPDDLDENFFRSLKGVRIAGQQLRLAPAHSTRSAKAPSKSKSKHSSNDENNDSSDGHKPPSRRPDSGPASGSGSGSDPDSGKKFSAGMKDKKDKSKKSKPKAKSKRTNKDKGKRRKPTASPPAS